MNWLAQNWQTAAALAVVALTVALLAWRLVRGKRSGSCGGGCNCGGKRGGGLQPPSVPRKQG